jgi:hypothetical protein
MLSHSAQKRSLRLLTGIALALCLAASPAHAKKHGGSDGAERGGLFQAPAAIAKPTLLLDTSVTKVIGRKGDALRQNSPDAVPATSAASVETVPVKAVEPTRSIESMRLHSLFE